MFRFPAVFLTALTLFAQPRTAAHEQALKRIDEVLARGPFKGYWHSLEKYQPPQWFLDAKFGIFIHWGVFSVSAFDDWYARHMYVKTHAAYRHHIATYGSQIKFGYKDFIPKFTMDRFDPARYAELFERAGAKYVVPVAEHHDGFPLYDCSFTEWNAARMGPKRDLIAALGEAVRKRGMHFGVSSHRAENWWFYNGGREIESDVNDPRYAGLYGRAEPRNSSPDAAFLEDWLARSCEMVDKFHPDVFWFDWWIQETAFQPYLQKFAAYYYNRAAEWKQGAVIQYKFEAFPERVAILDLERGQLSGIRDMVWQNDTSVSKDSWFHKRDADYKTADSLVDDLVDIVSKNGVLLLNIGPKADGTVPEPEQQILLEIGRWLSVNGEAIYGARPWRVFGEGPTEVATGSFTDTKRQPFTPADFRFTSKGDSLYAVALAWPADGMWTIRTLGAGAGSLTREIRSVELLGSNATLKWKREPKGLIIEAPAQKPGEHACVLKITTG